MRGDSSSELERGGNPAGACVEDAESRHVFQVALELVRRCAREAGESTVIAAGAQLELGRAVGARALERSGREHRCDERFTRPCFDVDGELPMGWSMASAMPEGRASIHAKLRRDGVARTVRGPGPGHPRTSVRAGGRCRSSASLKTVLVAQICEAPQSFELTLHKLEALACARLCRGT